MPPMIDLTTQRFGRLRVLAPNGKTKRGQYRWLCECDCGELTSVAGNDLRTGHTTSCGCLMADAVRARRTKHGMTRSPEWRSWIQMHRRCADERAVNYARYGGQGTKVCAEWFDFSAFLDDMGLKPTPKHTIDRIDPYGHYEPGNCRWATALEQNRNKRGAS